MDSLDAVQAAQKKTVSILKLRLTFWRKVRDTGCLYWLEYKRASPVYRLQILLVDENRASYIATPNYQMKAVGWQNYLINNLLTN